MSGATDTLVAARRLLADPDRWTQSVHARDSHGRRCLPEDAIATCWCAQGALLREGTSLTIGPAVRVLRAASEELFGLMPAELNDRADHADVLRMFDRAIELAEAQP